jgi:hypothetical protein
LFCPKGRGMEWNGKMARAMTDLMGNRRRANAGDGLRLLARVAGADTDECLLWPFGVKVGPSGYETPAVYHTGRKRAATHVVMEMVGQPRPSLDLEICHACDTSLCVNPRHLRWDTRLANIRDMVERGRRKGIRSTYGERQGSAKLKEADVLAIRAQYAAGGVSQEALGRKYGVTQTMISRIVRNVGWKHLA